MDNLQDAIFLVQKKYYFCSIDLKDAYYSLRLHDEPRKFFRFSFLGKKFEFNSLVMGYTDAPRLFSKTMKPILSH